MLVLSVAGIILSILLLLEFYYPSVELMKMICSPEVARGCHYIAQSGYSSFAGIPFAAFGLFYYLLFFIITMIIDTAGDEHTPRLAGVLDLIVIPGLVTDIILAGVMIYLRAFCALCFATYCVNLLLLGALFLLHMRLHFGPRAALARTWQMLKQAPAVVSGRVIVLLAAIALVLLAATIYSMNNAIALRSGRESRMVRMQAFVDDFYSAEVEDVDFPATPLVLGNPDAELKIRVFSDFLCSACSHLVASEKILLSRYDGRIAFYYYNYPLEKECNRIWNQLIIPAHVWPPAIILPQPFQSCIRGILIHILPVIKNRLTNPTLRQQPLTVLTRALRKNWGGWPGIHERRI